MQCPGCGEELVLDLTSDDSLIEPGLSSTLAVGLHAEADQAARNTVATTVTLSLPEISSVLVRPPAGIRGGCRPGGHVCRCAGG